MGGTSSLMRGHGLVASLATDATQSTGCVSRCSTYQMGSSRLQDPLQLKLQPPVRFHKTSELLL
ncbi:hypothetical protein PGT21_008786 [Puccinia graminis f. sp. tritici]|uniref:Uncharacterized protein n=1 Tax=Puccinia graminis f. sp. tritici TaxID=56615 RepID=A0A5B0QHW7_PUCGR|nr:hypothetical protein PGT21_008786 [Puccinia graminis f. sp. tritici]